MNRALNRKSTCRAIGLNYTQLEERKVLAGAALASGLDVSLDLENLIVMQENEKPDSALDSEAKQYIGLTIEQAEQMARQNGLLFRVAKNDGEGRFLTQDLKPGRINAEVERGIVVGLNIEGRIDLAKAPRFQYFLPIDIIDAEIRNFPFPAGDDFGLKDQVIDVNSRMGVMGYPLWLQANSDDMEARERKFGTVDFSETARNECSSEPVVDRVDDKWCFDWNNDELDRHFADSINDDPQCTMDLMAWWNFDASVSIDLKFDSNVSKRNR